MDAKRASQHLFEPGVGESQGMLSSRDRKCLPVAGSLAEVCPRLMQAATLADFQSWIVYDCGWVGL